MSALPKEHAGHESIHIVPYEDSHHDEVIALISAIQQQEFGLNVTPEDQFDLRDIAGTYHAGRSNFWVAFYHGKLIGTIGLLDLENGIATIKKMFVRAAYRGNAVGRKLLETSLAWAREQGITDLYLGTAESFTVAQRFYERNGFVMIDDAQVPEVVLPTLLKVDTRRYHRKIEP